MCCEQLWVRLEAELDTVECAILAGFVIGAYAREQACQSGGISNLWSEWCAGITA